MLAPDSPVNDVAKLAGHPLQEAHWIFAKPQESAPWIAGFGAGREMCHKLDERVLAETSPESYYRL